MDDDSKLQPFLYAVVQNAVTKGITILVGWHFWTPGKDGDNAVIISLATAFIVDSLASWWRAHRSQVRDRISTLTALALGKSDATVNDVKRNVDAGNIPDPKTPPDIVPVIQPKP